MNNEEYVKWSERALGYGLQAKRYTFKSKSDTEILIHLYDKFGYEMLDKLNGIF